MRRAHPREGTHAREVQVHGAALREVDQHAPHEQLEAAVSDCLCARAEIGNRSKYVYDARAMREYEEEERECERGVHR